MWMLPGAFCALLCTFSEGNSRFPSGMTGKKRKSKRKGKDKSKSESNGKSNGKGNSRFPSGMTGKKSKSFLLI